MKKSRSLIATCAAAVAAGTGVAASVASASFASTDQPARHGELFTSGLVGRPTSPNLAVTIRNVAPGAVPWTLSSGTAKLDATGRLQVDLSGLVITGTDSGLDGTTGPVRSVVASLSCDGATSTLDTTGTVPLSPVGDARIDQRVSMPALCLAPIILVRGNAVTGPWIASTGF